MIMNTRGRIVPVVGRHRFAAMNALARSLSEATAFAMHRFGNPGKVPLNLIEVQSGTYLGEDDIVRVQDIYQRV